MFPDLEEGGLATYRSALVQNKHLAVLAKVTSVSFHSFIDGGVAHWYCLQNKDCEQIVVCLGPGC